MIQFSALKSPRKREMEQLIESFYKQDLHIQRFVERKISIMPNEHIILQGIRNSGKTNLIKHYLLGLRKSACLYVNCSDLRIETPEFGDALNAFCHETEIQTVVLDNYRSDIPLPNVPQIILSAEEPLTLDGFRQLGIKPLDFEEFLAFEHKYDESALNHFLQLGGLPGMHQVASEERVRYLQEALQFSLSDIELDIMRLASRLHTQKVSAFMLYERLRQIRKISKDMLYKSMDRLLACGYLLTLPKFDHPRAVKKLYLCDIAFKNALTTQKHFGRLFENMVFNELDKHHNELYYDEGIDFYLPDEGRAILCMAFGTHDMLFKKIEAIEAFIVTHEINTVEVVTMSSEARLEHPFVHAEMIPFAQWALSEGE